MIYFIEYISIILLFCVNHKIKYFQAEETIKGLSQWPLILRHIPLNLAISELGSKRLFSENALCTNLPHFSLHRAKMSTKMSFHSKNQTLHVILEKLLDKTISSAQQVIHQKLKTHVPICSEAAGCIQMTVSAILHKAMSFKAWNRPYSLQKTR